MLSDKTSGLTVCKHINIRTNAPTKEAGRGGERKEKREGYEKKKLKAFM
jgi:hypothetical protein